MKTEFTTEEIVKNKGCYNQKRINSLLFKHALNTLHNISLKPYIFDIHISKPEQIEFLYQGFGSNIHDILKSTDITLLDKRWFISTSCKLTLEEKKELFSKIVQIALPLWKNKLSIFFKDDKNNKLFSRIVNIVLPIWKKKLSIFFKENKKDKPYEIYNITNFADAIESSLKGTAIGYNSALRDIVYFIIACGDKSHSDKILETYINFFNKNV